MMTSFAAQVLVALGRDTLAFGGGRSKALDLGLGDGARDRRNRGRLGMRLKRSPRAHPKSQVYFPVADPELRLSFSAGDFRGASFAHRQMQGVDFSRANLIEANLEKANLEGADFNGALLIDARLRSAHLVSARFNLANLSGADLAEADLTDADFTDANLDHVEISGAIWGRTTKWPEKFAQALIQRSKEVEPGVFEIGPDPEGIRSGATMR